MDKQTANQLMDSLKATATQIAGKDRTVIVRARYGEDTCKVTVEFQEKAKTAGTLFYFNGSQYEFVRFDRRKYKFPVIARRVSNGKTYKLPRVAMEAIEGRGSQMVGNSLVI